MRYLILFFILIYLPIKANFIERISIESGISYRWDSLDWNIGSLNGSPNILSELIWKDLEIWQIDVQVRAFLCSHIYTRFQADYGWIVKGTNHDFDFLGNDRTQLFSHSISQSNRGCVYDFSGAIGYPLTWSNRHLGLVPLIGYSGHSQHLAMTDGEMVFNLLAPNEAGSIPHLDSTYRTRWYGPWLGIDAVFCPNCPFCLFATYEYHWVYYRAKAHWNLRPDMPDGFRHNANGYGHVLRVGARYDINPQWFASCFAHYQIWHTRLGTDVTNLIAENGNYFELYQPLNRVNWRSLAIAIIIAYRF